MSEKKRALFSFTKINKYYLIPFITPLFCFTCNFLVELMIKESNGLNFLYIPIISSIGDIIAGLIYFIQLYKNKNKNLDSNEVKEKEKNKYKIICIIIFMSFLVCSFTLCYNLKKELYLFLPFSINLIMSIVFSKFLLKIIIYKHQILSIIISIIGFIFILFLNIPDTYKKFYIAIIISL